MSAVVKRNTGDLTYEAVDANLAGGELVIPSTTATESGLQGVKAAGDAALTVLGVASKPSITAANRAALESSTDTSGFPVVNASVPSATLAVYNDTVCPVTYTAAAVAYGTKLVAAANGAVRAYVPATDDAAAVVGWCAQPGGVSAAGGPALARILV